MPSDRGRRAAEDLLVAKTGAVETAMGPRAPSCAATSSGHQAEAVRECLYFHQIEDMVTEDGLFMAQASSGDHHDAGRVCSLTVSYRQSYCTNNENYKY